MKITCQIAGFLLFMVILSSGRADTLKEQEHLQFADGLYAREMFDLALKEYARHLERVPKTVHADTVHFRMGECYLRLDRVEMAIQEFGRVFREYPNSKDFSKASLKLAHLLSKSGKRAEGIEILSALLKNKPPEDIASSALFLMGETLEATGKPSEALVSFEKIRQEYRQTTFYPYALLKLGQLYGAKKGNEDKALAAYDELKKNAKTSARIQAETLFQVGDLHFRRKAYEKSAESYKALITRYPKDPRAAEAALQAAWAAHNAGLYADALKLVTPPFPQGVEAEWLYLCANCERQLMKNDDAVAHYEKLIKEHPVSEFAKVSRFEIAVTYYKMGKCNEAIAHVNEVKVTPETAKDIYWLKAESYAQLEQPGEAIQYYRLIVEKYPKSDVAVDAMYRLAHHLQSRKEYKEASRYYNRLVEQYPGSRLAAQALYASAFCQTKAGSHEEAIRDWTALIKDYPKDPMLEEAFYQKAMSEIRLKRDADAQASLVMLGDRFQKSKYLPDAYYWRGVLKQNSGDIADAEKSFRSALASNPRKELTGDIQYQLAAVLQKKGAKDEAADLFQAVLSHSGRKFSPGILEWLAEYQYEKKEYERSATAAAALVGITKDPAWVQVGWCLSGRSLQAKGDMVGAREAFKKALDLKVTTPAAPEAALRLGEILLAEKQHKEAQANFEKAAEMSSTDEMLGIRARAYAGLGKVAQAGAQQERAIRFFMSVAVLYDDPNLVPECLAGAAGIFEKMGRKEDAERTWKELAARYPGSKLNPGKKN